MAGILAALIVLVSAFGLWLRRELASSYYGAENAESFIEIPRGADTDAIAEALEAGGALRYKLPFQLYVRWSGLARRLQAGEYRFAAPARPGEIAQRLVQGDVFFHAITVPEGLTARETTALLARSGLGNEREMRDLLSRTDWISDLDSRAVSLEGYLFPETYHFPRRINSEQILKAMIAQFRIRISKLLSAAPLPAGWTFPQIVNLASMIEKEAKVIEERRLVASVLANRLRKKIPLACDPTIIYALKQAGSYNGNLRKADLSAASPYNTYIHPGLPPGPIANPGIDSLLAAMSPARSDYLYYVSRNDGTHFFSKDLQSHLLAVARYQKQGARSIARNPHP
jgi:UPF0755 protein